MSLRAKRHRPFCSCPLCGPVDKWTVYDGKKVFTVENLSRAELERRQKAKQLKEGRYWLKWDEVPQAHKEAYLGTKSLKMVDIFQAFVADCPFCASAGFLTCERFSTQQSFDERGPDGYVLLYFVICTNHECGCHVKGSFDPMVAIKRWNQRVVALRAVVQRAEFTPGAELAEMNEMDAKHPGWDEAQA